MDGVEAAVRSLEDNSVFNAGRGAVITEEGTVELDAVVMDGDTLMTGLVANNHYKLAHSPRWGSSIPSFDYTSLDVQVLVPQVYITYT